jgi:flagellar basal-body rod modification protein FlgD
MSTTTGVSGTSSTGSTVGANKYNLKTEDFIKMMVTQLQNQDPMEPAKNQELLAQMSQIGQLQSSSSLQDTLKTVMLQSQLTNSGAMIGKSIKAMDADGNVVTGIVNSVKVVDGAVNLQLDNGQTMPLTSVTEIAGTPVGAAAAAAAKITAPVAKAA